jgi:nicotinate-nucleotide pyrophosphorylase (carboxylating)
MFQVVHNPFKAERMVLNSMQRMSAIATKTNSFVKLLEGTNTKILIPVKLHPVFELPRMGREIGWRREPPFALYDMIMLKDNHIDLQVE